MFRPSLQHTLRLTPSAPVLPHIPLGRRADLGAPAGSSHLLPSSPSCSQRRHMHSFPPSTHPYRSSLLHLIRPSCSPLRRTTTLSSPILASPWSVSSSSSSSSPHGPALRRGMGISSEDTGRVGKAAPGSPKWMVKRNPPNQKIYVRERQTKGGLQFTVRRESAEDKDNSLRAMFRDFNNLDWNVKPLVLWFSATVTVWGFFAVSDILVAAAKTSKIAQVGADAQAQHDGWVRNVYVSWNGLKEGRIWTLLTNGVTHERLYKLLPDLIFSLLIGPHLVRGLGSASAFASLCATSSVVGSLGGAGATHYLGEDDKMVSGGAATFSGCITYFALSRRGGKFITPMGMPFAIYTWIGPVFLIPYLTWSDYNVRKDLTDPDEKPGGELVAPFAGALGGTLFFIGKKLLRL